MSESFPTQSKDTVAARLEAPYFLVALPQMQDAVFGRAVVFIVSHDADGAFGLILNKSLLDEEEGSSAMMKAEIKNQEGEVLFEFNEDLFEGGPAHTESVFLLHDIEEEAELGTRVANESLFVTSDPNSFQNVLKHQEASAHKRFYLGCSAWNPGQLDAESRSGAWISLPFRSEFLFESLPAESAQVSSTEDRKLWQEDLWKRVLLASGLDPLTLIGQGSSDAGLN